jgi:hypothetical protein
MENQSRLTMQDIVKMPFERQMLVLQYHVQSGLFRTITNYTENILLYTTPFLQKDCLNDYFKHFIYKLDFTTSLENDIKGDHKYLLDTIRLGIESIFYSNIFDKNLRAFEVDSLQLKGEKAEQRAAELHGIIGRLRIDTRNLTSKKSITSCILPFHSAVFREGKKLDSLNYMLLFASYNEAMLLDLLDRYVILFDSLRTGASFKPLPAPTQKKPNLTSRQLALLLYYQKKEVTRENAKGFLIEGLTSGSALFNDLNAVTKKTERTGSVNKRQVQYRLNDFQTVKQLLDGEAKKDIEGDIKAFLQNNDNWL